MQESLEHDNAEIGITEITNINNTKKFEEETNVEKEFKCHICDRIYGLKKNLNKHLKSHTGTKI